MLVRLGTFPCDSGTLVVSDPCYARHPWRDNSSVSIRLAPAISGEWEVWHEWIDDPEAPEPSQPRSLVARYVFAPELDA